MLQLPHIDFHGMSLSINPPNTDTTKFKVAAVQAEPYDVLPRNPVVESDMVIVT